MRKTYPTDLTDQEWEKTYKELEPTGKKSILFIMTDDTKNCDDVAEFLQKSYPQLKGAVLRECLKIS